MSWPIPFSFGDFVAGIQVVAVVVRAVSDAHGSNAEYRKIVDLVETTQSGLSSIKSVCSDNDVDKKLVLELAISLFHFQKCLEEFVNEIGKFAKRLKFSSEGWRRLQAAPRQIQFALLKKGRIEKFRIEIQNHVQTVYLKIAPISWVYQIRMQRSQDQVRELIHSNITKQQELAVDNARVHDLVAAKHQGQHAQFQLLQEQFTDYRTEIMRSIDAMRQTQIEHARLQGHTLLESPGQSSMMLFDYATILDARGQHFHFPTQFVDSPMRLIHHLCERFKLGGVSELGLRWIRDKHFVLFAEHNGHVNRVRLNDPHAWQRHVKPGASLWMSASFKPCPSKAHAMPDRVIDNIEACATDGYTTGSKRISDLEEPTTAVERMPLSNQKCAVPTSSSSDPYGDYLPEEDFCQIAIALPRHETGDAPDGGEIPDDTDRDYRIVTLQSHCESCQTRHKFPAPRNDPFLSKFLSKGVAVSSEDPGPSSGEDMSVCGTVESIEDPRLSNNLPLLVSKPRFRRPVAHEYTVPIIKSSRGCHAKATRYQVALQQT